MPGTPEQIDRALSRQLKAKAEALGVYQNKTGKGDGREDAVREIVGLRVGTAFGVVKAEVADSLGAGTLEHDAVIYDQSSASCLFALGHRRVVRVEAVAITMEVKSDLNASAIEQVVDAVDRGLAKLTRFYEPEQALRLVDTITQLKNFKVPGAEAFQGTRAMLDNGLNALQGHIEIPPIVNVVFAYDGPSIETATEYMKTPRVDAICVLDKYVLVKKQLGTIGSTENIENWGDGPDALGSFLCLLEGLLDKFRSSRHWVRPNIMRYYTHRSS